LVLELTTRNVWAFAGIVNRTKKIKNKTCKGLQNMNILGFNKIQYAIQIDLKSIKKPPF